LSIAEPFRLFFGYSGNLHEKVPQLFAFVLLSVFPQMVMVIYLLAIHQFALDFALNLLMLLFLIPEVIFGIRTLKVMIRIQATKFYLQYWQGDDTDTKVS